MMVLKKMNGMMSSLSRQSFGCKQLCIHVHIVVGELTNYILSVYLVLMFLNSFRAKLLSEINRLRRELNYIVVS